ncbi:MAG: LLM class flavin-dependent oxidoreductase, partial [Nitrososphaerales archaeon]
MKIDSRTEKTLMPLKFGFSIRGVEPIIRMAELAQRAEEAGFDQIWTADSHAIFKELYVTLTAMALRTHRVNLG